MVLGSPVPQGNCESQHQEAVRICLRLDPGNLFALRDRAAHEHVGLWAFQGVLVQTCRVSTHGSWARRGR